MVAPTISTAKRIQRIQPLLRNVVPSP